MVSNGNKHHFSGDIELQDNPIDRSSNPGRRDIDDQDDNFDILDDDVYDIDDDDNETYGNTNSSRYNPLHGSSNQQPVTLLQKLIYLINTIRFKIIKFISLNRTRSIGFGLFILFFFIWVILLISYANHGKLTDTNEYTPAVGNYTNIPPLSNNDGSSGEQNEQGKGKGEEEGVVKTLRRMTLEEQRMGTFYPFYRDFDIVDIPILNSFQDEGYYTHHSGSSFVLKKLSNKEFNKIILANNVITYNGLEYHISKIIMSPKLDKVILISNIDRLFRHSSLSNYFILDLKTSIIKPILIKKFMNKDTKEEIEEIPKLYHASFSTNGTYITSIYENNIYLTSFKEKSSTSTSSSSTNTFEFETKQITNDGSKDIFNGRSDWIYEEEVLGSDISFWWSQDEKFFSFLKLNDEKVPIYDLDYFISEEPDKILKYPNIKELKYPKPGFNNPIPSIHIYSIKDKTIYDVDKIDDNSIQDNNSEESLGKDFILYDASWVSNTELLLKETNRESKIMHIKVININNLKKKKLNKSEIIRIVNATDFNGWISNNGRLLSLPIETSIDNNDNNNKDELLTGYIDFIVYNGYNHLAYYANATASTPTIVLTHGDYEVVGGPLGYDPIKRLVYYIGTSGNAISRQLYSVHIDTNHHELHMANNGTDVESPIVALTDDTLISHFTAQFSPSGKYGVISYRGPSLPYQKIIDMHQYSRELLEKSTNIIESDILDDRLKSYAIPEKDYYTRSVGSDPITGEEIFVDVIEVRPPVFDSNKKYPVLVSVYGGPGAQKLSCEFNYGFEEIVSSSLDVVVLYIDPRGTGNKGWKFRSYAKGKIGYWEPRDILTVTSELIKENQYMDSDKTAIWGWSYGGFTTLKTLEEDTDNVFKYGMAVAPVTNWLFYDSIYTERYMNKPNDNIEGYKNSKISNFENFKNKIKFLIMHGTSDDNVHFQNTLNLLDKFNLNKIENYELLIFPDSNHNISNHNAYIIVFDKLFNWLKSAFNNEFLNQND
ncbi:hydrolase activity protein [[Candida] boidinii]|nr:hydrolase activity protein [[Candida] boidinii]